MVDSQIEFLARGLWLDRGRVLVCRSLSKHYCYLPGGHVEFGESADEALVREMKEECGLDVKVGPPLLCLEQRFWQGGTRRHELSIVFHVEQPPPDRILSQESHIAFEWLEMGALVDVDLRPDVMKAWLLSNEAIPEDGPRWISHEAPRPD